MTSIPQILKLPFICTALSTLTVNSCMCVCVRVHAHVIVCVQCVSLGPAETLSWRDQACQECHLQSLYVRLILGRGNGASKGAVSRQPAALGADSPLWRGSGSQWRSNRRYLQVRKVKEQKELWKEWNREYRLDTAGFNYNSYASAMS